MKYRCGANGMKTKGGEDTAGCSGPMQICLQLCFPAPPSQTLAVWGTDKIFFAVPVDVDSSDLLPGGRASCVTCASASVSVATMGALFTAFMALALLPVVEVTLSHKAHHFELFGGIFQKFILILFKAPSIQLPTDLRAIPNSSAISC